MLKFSANIRQTASVYVVEFFNSPTNVIFRYETADWDLANRLQIKAMWLFYKWQAERPKQTGPSGWATFDLVAQASDFPTRTGGHAVIFTEIENAYL